MATINIPTGGGTFTANSGDVFNIPAGATGDIVINGATDFIVNIQGNLTGGGGDNLRLIQFGADSQPTVNIPAGVDTSPYAIDANGENLTVNVGDGATIGDIDGSNLDATGIMTVTAGENVTVQGFVDNLGPADAVISFGNGANIAESVYGSAGGSADLSFGDNATIGGNVTGATGSTVGQTSSISFGDGANLSGQIISNHGEGDRTVVLGNDANVANAITLSGASTGSAFLTIGDNAVVGGNITGTSNNDTFVIGNNYDLANINLLLGDDTLNIGTQAIGAGLTQIDGGNPNGSDTDLIRIGVRPDQQADFDAAGWINNGDGTYSSPGPTFDGSQVTAGNLVARDFEGAAAPICFAGGTLILTPGGEVPVETLRQGDLVMTMDHGLQPVRWIGVQEKSGAALAAAKNLRPVRIKAGALGDGYPQSDLLVSQQHRMLIRSIVAKKMFGEAEVLVPAKHLVPLDGVEIIDDGKAVTYVHFLCDAHEIVFANGAPCETLFTGPQALKSVSAAARAEILAIFPELSDIDYKALSARNFVNSRQGRRLAVRHNKNCKALLQLH